MYSNGPRSIFSFSRDHDDLSADIRPSTIVVKVSGPVGSELSDE